MDDASLLALWESALGCTPAAREDRLVAAACGGTAPRALGERNAALLRLRRVVLGRSLALVGDCPRCGSSVEFALDVEALGGAGAEAPRREAVASVGDRRFALRLPDADELRALAARHRDDRAALERALLHACIAPEDGGGVDEAERAALLPRLEALDPRASLGVALACPDCGHAWDAPLDLAAIVWPELRRRAEQLLLDVAVLARAFGWSEDAVLRLGATRRAAYLQLAGAA